MKIDYTDLELKEKLKLPKVDKAYTQLKIGGAYVILNLLEFMPKGNVPPAIQDKFPDFDFSIKFDDEFTEEDED